MFKDEKALTPTSVRGGPDPAVGRLPEQLPRRGLGAHDGALPDRRRRCGDAAIPVGTGPFSFDSWTQNDSFKVKRNPTYWGGLDANGKRRTGHGLPYLDSIEFKVITDDGTRTAALQNGDINMEYTTSAADANKLADSYTVRARTGTPRRPSSCPTRRRQVNGKANPLHNIHARMALAYATDRARGRQADRRRRPGPDLALVAHQPVGHAQTPERLRRLRPGQGQGRGRPVRARPPAQTSLSLHPLGPARASTTPRSSSCSRPSGSRPASPCNIETLEQTAYITKIATGGYQAAFFRNYGYPDPDQDYYFWSSTTAKGVGNVSINFTQYTHAPDRQGPDDRAARAATPTSARRPTTTWSKQLNAGAHQHLDVLARRTRSSPRSKVKGLDAPDGPAHDRLRQLPAQDVVVEHLAAAADPRVDRSRSTPDRTGAGRSGWRGASVLVARRPWNPSPGGRQPGRPRPGAAHRRRRAALGHLDLDGRAGGGHRRPRRPLRPPVGARSSWSGWRWRSPRGRP